MSSGPCAATESASATTCAGSRRSMPTIRSRCSQSALSGIAVKRRTASCGKRVVIVVCAPSRSSRSAMYMPILARPPVSSARRPVRSVRASRLARFERGAVRAELVVERVDLVVAAACRCSRRAAGAACRRWRPVVGGDQRHALRSRRRCGRARRWRWPRSRRGRRRATAARRSAPAGVLDGLEDPRGRPAHRDGVGVVVRQLGRRPRPRAGRSASRSRSMPMVALGHWFSSPTVVRRRSGPGRP